jgi:ribose transport system substrate-binding protein
MTAEQSVPSGGKMRHLLVVVVVAVVAAAAIAWMAGAFRAPPKVAIVTSTDDPYWDRVILGAQTAAKQFDVNLSVVRSKGDEQVQSQAIRDLVAQGNNGIGVSPVNAQTQAGLLTEVGKKGVLVTFDSDCPTAPRFAFIGTDNYLAGKQSAQLVREAIPDGGEVVICVGSIDKDNGRERRQGLIDNMLERPADSKRTPDPVDVPIKAGKYTIAATLIDGADPAKATAMAVDAIKTRPNLKCFVGLFGYSTPSLLDALKETGKLGQIKVCGFDEAEQTLAGIESGNVYGTLVQDQYNMGYDTVRYLCESIYRVPSEQPGVHMQYLPCRAIASPDDVQIIRYEKAREAKTPATRPA